MKPAQQGAGVWSLWEHGEIKRAPLISDAPPVSGEVWARRWWGSLGSCCGCCRSSREALDYITGPPDSMTFSLQALNVFVKQTISTSRQRTTVLLKVSSLLKKGPFLVCHLRACFLETVGSLNWTGFSEVPWGNLSCFGDVYLNQITLQCTDLNRVLASTRVWANKY